MTVEILWLSGLEVAAAQAAAEKLLDIDNGPSDLTNLLVVDDTALLAEHEPVYIKIDNSVRTQKKLCVAVGARAAGGDRKWRLPVNLGGTGIPVLWVSSPTGINCRVAVAAVALGHAPGKVSGLDILIEILLDQEMYEHVHEIFTDVPYRVANPGMWLVGQDDEAATFAAALVLAVRALCGAGPGAEGPFRELLPSATRGASLAEDSPLARYRDEVFAASEGLGKRSGLGGRFRPGQADLRSRVIEAGAALADLREEVSRLLRNANAVGDLTENQRRLIADAGIVFPTGPAAAATGRVSGAVAEQPLIYRAIVNALQGGDALPLVSRRLTLTERELKHSGSGSYLPQVDERCSPKLIDRLANPPERPSRRGAADARPEQDLAQAAEAARALENLVLTVASLEWSPLGPSRSEVSRIRAALDGAGRGMTEYAGKAGTSGQARGARPARLAGMLAPVLRDLVIEVVGAEITRPSATAHEALDVARNRTDTLIKDWTKRVQADGIASQTPFSSTNVPYAASYASADDVTEIREALLYQPVDEMWQLCRPDDLKNALDLRVQPVVLGFAGRANKDALGKTLSRDPVWTTSGSNAGLLRLVSLRQEYVSTGHAPADLGELYDAEPS
jgi:hypothetical protein